MKKLKEKQKWIFTSLFLLLFTLITILILKDKITPLDNAIYKFSQYFYSDFTTLFCKIITNFAGVPFLATIGLISVVILYLKRENKKGITLFFNLIFIGVMIIGFKYIFARPRPIDIMLIHEKGFSFPSGHALGSTAFYGYLIYLLYCSNIKKYKKILGISFFSFLIFLIGFSRIYLGVHFGSDVIAGILLGIVYLILFITMMDIIVNKKDKNALWKSFDYAITGITNSLKKERNLRIHILIMSIVIIFGYILSISLIEWCICFLCFALVISLELVNTALETSIDLFTKEKSVLAKNAKDAMAGAVLISAIASIIIGLIIFLPKLTLVR